MRRCIGLVLAVTMVSGCLGAGDRPSGAVPAASIDYALPVTTAKIELELTLVNCAPLTAKAKAAITPIANMGTDPAEQYRLYGANLQSFTKKRDIAVDLYENRAIKTINSSVEDRTGAIITGALKTFTGIAALAGPDPAVAFNGQCNSATQEALTSAQNLEARIKSLKADLPQATPAETAAIGKSIDALSAELASLRMNALALKLGHELFLRNGDPSSDVDGLKLDMQGGIILWSSKSFSKWVELPDDVAERTDWFALAFCLSDLPPMGGKAVCTQDLAKAASGIEKQFDGERYVERPECFAEDINVRCPKAIVFRNPVAKKLTLISYGSGFADSTSGKLASSDLAISHWGDLAVLPLSAGFGESYSLSASLDPFGRKTSFKWGSGARGEAIVGQAASITSAFGELYTDELEGQLAEIKRLETQQKLNKLKQCQEIIEAGGFTCPAEQ